MRLGFTTGTCAALAAQAATRMLLTGETVDRAALLTPKGIAVEVPIADPLLTADLARCAVKKDAGDDPDITDGILVYAEARRLSESAIRIDGGDGVGRVTKPGLEQPVGAAAINSVPRSMIEREVRAVCDELGHTDGVAIVISIPGGEALAARTFNPKLGVVGGLSIIGSSGIVEPMSSQALIDVTYLEMKAQREAGAEILIITPGNYGESFLRENAALAGLPYVKCANFLGEALDAAVALGFMRLLIVGHIGKLVKLSGGVMDTHSRVADCRLELLALQAALQGESVERLRSLLEAATVDAGLELLEEAGLRKRVIGGLLARAERYVERRLGGALPAGIVTFRQRRELLGMSDKAVAILAGLESGDGE